MKLLRLPIYAALALALVPGPALAERDGREDMTVLGYVEDVHVGKLGLEMKGKLDTGADSSSVYGRDVKVYKKSGKDDWVTFRLRGKNGRTVRYDQDVRRFALIKLKTGGTIRRPVIHLPICVGGVRGLAEVNLADREDFEYDILIGREFLASRVLVDSASTFIADDECNVPERD
ncbi:MULTISPECIES: ATP-dependent zinc protease [Hyphomonas]|uniref:ATP-dependent zinc protease family protein n=1 Tax=Hyphomonas TaxID=85 RepID=UPI00235253B0|nr:RimK/LysX family protein [Hyphomonas adhaerens]